MMTQPDTWLRGGLVAYTLKQGITKGLGRSPLEGGGSKEEGRTALGGTKLGREGRVQKRRARREGRRGRMGERRGERGRMEWGVRENSCGTGAVGISVGKRTRGWAAIRH